MIENEISIVLNPHEDKIIGIVGSDIYFKPQYEKSILIVKRKEYLRILNLYLNVKKSFCKRYDHFCGVFGELQVLEYETYSEGFKINEINEVEDDGENDGIEIKEVKYPLFRAIKFDNRVDMEHG